MPSLTATNQTASRDKLAKILAIGPFLGQFCSQVQIFEPSLVAVNVSRDDEKSFRLSGPQLFSAIDIIGCFSLWHLQDSVRSIFTTNMAWNCYRPITGSVIEIKAEALGFVKNFATVEITISVIGSKRRKAATALATAYLRGFDGDKPAFFNETCG